METALLRSLNIQVLQPTQIVFGRRFSWIGAAPILSDKSIQCPNPLRLVGLSLPFFLQAATPQGGSMQTGTTWGGRAPKKCSQGDPSS